MYDNNDASQAMHDAFHDGKEDDPLASLIGKRPYYGD
jgi:hypothetical protein